MSVLVALRMNSSAADDLERVFFQVRHRLCSYQCSALCILPYTACHAHVSHVTVAGAWLPRARTQAHTRPYVER